MKDKTINTRRLDALDTEARSPEIFRSVAKQWRKRVGYCSLFAAIPAILATPLGEARSDELNKPDTDVAERERKPQRSNLTLDSRRLLKRQSEFRLPHQRAASFNMIAAFGGNDNCPGRLIPGGKYTSTLPFVDSGDTTGADNTVNQVCFGGVCYDLPVLDSPGPDHVYTFTLNGRGPNPQIQVSTTSETFQPLIYILDDTFGGCPSGTANYVFNGSIGAVGTINSSLMYLLPLNVPLHLFIDSFDSNSGPYTMRMQDVTIAPAAPECVNPIDCPEFFVRQHYQDFLSRQAEADGLIAWIQVMTNCPDGDQVCRHEQRLTTSAGFFGSTEFQLKGYFVFRFYRTAFARLPAFTEIVGDMQSVTGSYRDETYARRIAFTDNFAKRPEFTALYNGLSNAQYVAALMGRYGLTRVTTPFPPRPDSGFKITLTQAELVSQLDFGSITRAQVLRAIADSDEVFQSEYNAAFVAMQYYGYLRRTPEVGGYTMWLDFLNTHPGDFREMIRGFVDSNEYRSRFGQP